MHSYRRRLVSVSEYLSFKGYRFPPDVIILAVRWYLRWHCCIKRAPALVGCRRAANVCFGRTEISRSVRFAHAIYDAKMVCPCPFCANATVPVDLPSAPQLAHARLCEGTADSGDGQRSPSPLIGGLA